MSYFLITALSLSVYTLYTHSHTHTPPPHTQSCLTPTAWELLTQVSHIAGWILYQLSPWGLGCVCVWVCVWVWVWVCVGFPGGASSKVSACQFRRWKRSGFLPWVRKIPWSRAWQPIPVFLPGESPWTEEPGRLQFTGSKRDTTEVI